MTNTIIPITGPEAYDVIVGNGTMSLIGEHLGQGVAKDAGKALELLLEAERNGSLLAAPFIKAASAAVARAEAAP